MRAAPDARYYLLINSDAWVVADAIERLKGFADENPRVAVVGPRLRNPDGSLQRSVRGFPTLWRLATEYLFLRKLAPRSQALNAFYAGGFEHYRTYEAEFLMAACLLVRREATDEVGLFDERYFMFSEEVDWCYRFHQAGWGVWYDGTVTTLHVKGGTTIDQSRRARHRDVPRTFRFNRSMGRFYRKFYAGRRPLFDGVIYAAIVGKIAIAVTRSVIARRGFS